MKNNFRNNYQNTNTLCPLCELENDSQEHLFVCKKIMEVHNHYNTCQHDDVFSNDTDTLLKVALTLIQLVKIREDLLKEEST